MITKYRMWCETNSKFEYVISDSVPTECPVNAAHTVKGITVHQENVLVRDGSPLVLTLANYKQLRYNEIDGKTLQLLSAGFTFDGSQFSLSEAAQLNWNALKTNESDFTWPVEVSTKDNYGYSLAQLDLDAFWTAAKDAVKGHLDSGRALKKSVFDAVDEAAVDAVVDTR